MSRKIDFVAAAAIKLVLVNFLWLLFIFLKWNNPLMGKQIFFVFLSHLSFACSVFLTLLDGSNLLRLQSER